MFRSSPRIPQEGWGKTPMGAYPAMKSTQQVVPFNVISRKPEATKRQHLGGMCLGAAIPFHIGLAALKFLVHLLFSVHLLHTQYLNLPAKLVAAEVANV